MMEKCKLCGRELDEEDLYCSRCDKIIFDAEMDAREVSV